MVPNILNEYENALFELRKLLAEIATLAHVPHDHHVEDHITARVRLRRIEALALQAKQLLGPEK